jgi:hypothetical protein
VYSRRLPKAIVRMFTIAGSSTLTQLLICTQFYAFTNNFGSAQLREDSRDAEWYLVGLLIGIKALRQ